MTTMNGMKSFTDTATGINVLYETLELVDNKRGLRTQLILEMMQLTQTINEQLIAEVNRLEEELKTITTEK